MILTRSARIEETSMNHIESITQLLLVTDFHRTFSNELCPSLEGNLTTWSFGISKFYPYLVFSITLQCHYMRIIKIVTSCRIDNGC